MQKSGPNITVSPVFQQDNRMQQEQHQVMNFTIEQAVENALSYVRKHHTEE